ncbi:MAG: multifunctional CCA tRNA nucleotidyl transferase/2'3'-cyclic phosphodiesterase/2'nucleotidase/phosphatase, partial [Pseudomonas sp.]|nr:multifunctional CCA tRNA nucleotidyl transferase/2'3'-cyclic phosphodiesterase/2'nucleotidase/phosphatase [Pseudomonas sp.]
EADARGRTGLENEPYPQADYLRAAARAARNVSVESLLSQGLEGAELGKGLERERERAIADFKTQMTS